MIFSGACGLTIWFGYGLHLGGISAFVMMSKSTVYDITLNITMLTSVGCSKEKVSTDLAGVMIR